MDFSAVSSAVNTIGELLVTEVASLWGVKDQVDDLHWELIWMLRFLEKAAARKVSDGVMRTQVAEIRELAYDAEDVIETFALKVAPRKKGGFSKVIKRYACILNEGWLLYQTKSEIERITARITKLTRRLQTYKLDDDRSRDEVGSSNQMQQLRRTYTHIPDDNVVGLADDINQLVSVLVDEESDCRVVFIRGMGGLGKTTLAKKIYHDSRVVDHFGGMRSFVYVSQQCQQKKVWEDALKILVDVDEKESDEDKNKRGEDVDVDEKKKDEDKKKKGDDEEKRDEDKKERGENVDTDKKKRGKDKKKGGEDIDAEKKVGDQDVAKKLYNFLKNEKCLVILDDIWTKEAWDLLKPAFPLERDTKSKYLVTSRDEVVPIADNRIYRHELQDLNHDQSWKLFQKIAFPQTGNTVDAEKEKLGKKIIDHCAGLPLAITVVGGILATKTRVNEWQMVIENFNSHLKKTSKGPSTMDVLALSFYDLPPYLRPCFLYLSVFPEDYKIRAERLIQLWIAEGLVSSEEGEVMEDVAERWLVELVERCMLQVVKRSRTLKIVSCRMHDLMRELCVSMARKEGFVRMVDDPPFPPSSKRAVRRVVSHQFNLFRTIESSPLRSLLFFYNSFTGDAQTEAFLDPKMLKYFKEHEIDKDCNSKLEVLEGCWRYLFKNFELLRVLDFEECDGYGRFKLPSAIGNLIHLRFLKFGQFKFWCPRIPSSLGNLSCLQSLDLEDLQDIIYVPDVIWKLEELRHLYLPYDMDKKTKLKLHTLRNLQTLINFKTRNCFVVDLSKLTNLRKLKILGSLDKEDFMESLDKNQPIFTSKYLQSLSIRYDGFDERIDPEVLGHLLSSCVNLCELKVVGKTRMLPAYDYLPSTTDYIQLRRFGNKGMLPAYDYFPSTIAYIHLEGLELAEDLISKLEKLPSLRILELKSWIFTGKKMGKKMVFSAPNFPQLESLSLDWLSGLEEWKVEEGAMPALRHLKIKGCLDLEMLPEGLRFITTLQELKIEEMPKRFKDKMVQGGQDFYKIQHVPSVIFSNIK